MSRSTVDTGPGPGSGREPDTEPQPGDDRAFFGRPKGLLTLSRLEAWEHSSFLGMRAIPVLCFADALAHGGMGMAAGTAASVSAAYGTLVCLVPVADGRLADRMLGSYRAVLWDGILIACGHYAMAVPTPTMTWVGLGLISAGTGLLKPDVATTVGRLHRTDEDRRNAGFALCCMAISIGAFAGPLITGRLGDHKGWHCGFSAAATGMAFGLIQYVAGRRHLAGRRHSAEFAPRRRRDVPRRPLGDIPLETSGGSATTKLAPAAFAGQTMPLWFLSLALANGIRAQTVKLYDDVSKPASFGVNGAILVAAGLAVMALAPWLRRATRAVH